MAMREELSRLWEGLLDAQQGECLVSGTALTGGHAAHTSAHCGGVPQCFPYCLHARLLACLHALFALLALVAG